MKLQQILKLLMALFVAMGLVACNDSKSGHDHDDHDHDDHDHKHGDGHHHDHADHDHADDHDHEHEGATHVKDPGPNGGRVLHKVEPHLEFLVTDSRHVKITALDDDLKPVAMGGQEIRITGGDRSNPISLELARDGDVLLSTAAFPEGDDFPVVVQIKDGSGDAVFEKFTLDFSDCPTCDYLEYACICAHGEGDHDSDHNHNHK